MLLTPDVLFDSYRDITPAFLRQREIGLLLTDLDYTLAPKAVRRPDDALRRWIAAMENAGITVMIVSNNRSGQRVTEFCADLGVGFQGHAGKLLTDMLAARRAGVLALMVEPLGGPVGAWNRFLHLLQRPFKAACPLKMQKKPKENTK